ncbi:MAG TPA: hypothetical protein VHF47_05545 [Acidimicrobiales bacterium]|nr:hypothetical protein [Acidimicrobiales bacterium]
MASRGQAGRVAVMLAVWWALVGSVVTVLLWLAVVFPVEATAVATVVLALVAVGFEIARLQRGFDP